MTPLLEIRGLRTHFSTDDGIVQAVDGVDITINKGETLCVVGESGCGKTVTAMSILKLIAMPPGRIVEGQILFEGRDLVPLTSHDRGLVTQPRISRHNSGLRQDSFARPEDIRAVDASRLQRRLGSASDDDLTEVRKVIRYFLDL